MWSKIVLTCCLLSFIYVRCEDEDEGSEEESNLPPPPPLRSPILLGKDYGYEIEKFDVVSSGYILDVYHIKPKTPGGPTVLMQHGLMASSDCWILKNDSVAYELVDAGNDVWLSNGRGNVYGRRHEKLKPEEDEAFWDFSWHDMAINDLPTVIDFILKQTGQPKLQYIGHSMGGTMFFVMLSEKPEMNEKISQGILIAPVGVCHKFQFMVNKDSSMYQMMTDTLKQFDDKKKWEAFPRPDVPKSDHQLQCSDLPDMAVSYCTMGMDMTKKVVGDWLPAGAAVRILKHYAQSFTNGKIQPFDYGDEMNVKKYNQKTPPEYNFKNVKVPVHLIYAPSDQVLDPSDIEELAKELPNVATNYLVAEESFGHVDFLLPTNEDVVQAFVDVKTKIKEIIKK